MGKFTFDFGKVNELPADGIYNLEITASEAIEPKDEGKFVYFKLTCKIQDGEHAGKTVWHNLSFSPKAMWMTQIALEAITHRDWRTDGMEIDPEDLIGRRFRAVLVREEQAGYPPKMVIHSFDTSKGVPITNGPVPTSMNQNSAIAHGVVPQAPGDSFRL